jgi:large subunit ribosomal protein L17
MYGRKSGSSKLGRPAAQRKALMRSLASQVILYESIKTTLPKAKAVRPIVEKLITRAKKGTDHDRRVASKFLSANNKALEKLFIELGPLYKNRQGGYVRIVKLGKRNGDGAEMAQIQLLDTEKLTKKEMEIKLSDKKPAVKKTEAKKKGK